VELYQLPVSDNLKYLIAAGSLGRHGDPVREHEQGADEEIAAHADLGNNNKRAERDRLNKS
jgi:hypothetical protein